MFVSGYHVVYHLLGNVSLCTVKKSLKLALDFFNCIFLLFDYLTGYQTCH